MAEIARVARRLRGFMGAPIGDWAEKLYRYTGVRRASSGSCKKCCQLLLEDYSVARVQAGENFSARAVGDAGLDGELAAPLLILGGGDFDGGVAVLVVEYGLLRDRQG